MTRAGGMASTCAASDAPANERAVGTRMSLRKVEAKEVEVVVFLDDGVNVGGVGWFGGGSDNVAKNLIGGEVAIAQRSPVPRSAILYQ